MAILQELIALSESLVVEGKRVKGLNYETSEVKGKVERISVKLAGADSKALTTLAKKYVELDESIELLSDQKKLLNTEIKAKVQDLFDAEDAVMTRVIETVSFSMSLAKQSAAGSSTDYEAIVKDLVAAVPKLKDKVDELTKLYTKTTKARDPALRVDAIKEGVIKDIFAYIAKQLSSFAAWCTSYDADLADMKARFKSISKARFLENDPHGHKMYESNDQKLSKIECIKKSIDTILQAHSTRIEEFVVEDDVISVDVEFDFPEYFVKTSEIKDAGKPFVDKVRSQKHEDWREGFSAATYQLVLKSELAEEEIKEVTDYLESEKKRTN